MKLICRLGIHKGISLGVQSVPSLFFGESGPVMRDVRICKYCNKKYYISFILGADAIVNDESYGWTPPIDIRLIRSLKIKKLHERNNNR